MPEYFIGLMSGTSVDAIDAVLMDFAQSNTHIVSNYSQAISTQLRDDINSLIATRQLPKNIEKLDKQFTETSCEAVRQLLKNTSIDAKQISAIGSHGQTVFHDPKGIPHISIQIGNAQMIANATGIPTIGNFRQADIDAGGQGAPLACAYHAKVLQSTEEERLVLNLGGIANITKLPKDKDEPIIGFDTGPANTLMDAWIQKHLNKPYDQDGNWAQSGKVNLHLLEQMLEDSYFTNLPPKSTGREHFNLEWIQHQLNSCGSPITIQDVQATLLALTTHSIVDSIDAWCPQTEKLFLCGGGSENKYLVQQLEKILDGKVLQYSSDYGAPTKWMEAMAFAWLAKLNLENKPGNIPSVTGADKAVVLGERKDTRI
ncbi:MAG: anhydro-N-acetylmuramic acid kinase [Gammaproteobacteria bacterium]|nr:anhydro-N-acetylmuramic acid kinase [Gammaproteobacteria bacterium]